MNKERKRKNDKNILTKIKNKNKIKFDFFLGFLF